MELSKILLNAGEALRPALTKIIPMKVLLIMLQISFQRIL